MDRLLLIIFCSVLLWTNLFGTEFEIIWFVYAQTIAYTLTAVVALIMLRSKSGKIKLSFKKDFSIVLLKNSFPYALLILLMMMYSRMDSVMLERLLPDGDIQAGIYAQGFRYLDAVNMFALLFAGMLLPVFARLLKVHGNVATHLELAVRLLVGMSLIVSLSAFFFQTELLELRYDNVSELSCKKFWLFNSEFYSCFTYLYLWNIAHGKRKSSSVKWHGLFWIRLKSAVEFHLNSAVQG
jgi:O-antigen/teichoic acid export membrane protein